MDAYFIGNILFPSKYRVIVQMKTKSLKVSDYFKLVKPNYVYLKLTPHKSTRNYNSSNIAKAISNTYKSIFSKIKYANKVITIQEEYKFSYIIDMKADGVDFYFITPLAFESIILEKMSEIWKKITIERVENIPELNLNSKRFTLGYKMNDCMSLKVDTTSNEPLGNVLSIMDVLKNDDRVTVISNFKPITNMGWKAKFERFEDEVKEGKPQDKDTLSVQYIMKMSLFGLSEILEAVTGIIADVFGGDSKKGDGLKLYKNITTVLGFNEELSKETKRKKNLNVIGTQILVNSYSADKERATMNGIAVAESYNVLDGDNKLIYKPYKKEILFDKYNYTDAIDSKLSVEECHNFLQQPARTLLVQHKINHIKVEETKVPVKLLKGYISLGVHTFKGEKVETFIEDDVEIGSLPLMLIGRQGGGKTTYLCNYAKYCLGRNESVFHIDYIKNCEASKSIEKAVSKKDVIVLDFSTEEGLQSLAYNEIKFNEGITWFEKQQLANKKTELTLQLVNAINTNGEPLSPKMERYLCACTDIVYLNENATLKDVSKCLQDYSFRLNIINNIPIELRDTLADEIQTLDELNEWSKVTKKEADEGIQPEVIGTRDSKIDGIIDRIQLLKRDFYLKQMFNKTPAKNIDFVKAMDEGKVVLIRMPQSKFKKYVKNVITTFIITKCWLACELRGENAEKLKRTHIIIDEISQTPTAEAFMESILTQTRKFGMKFVLAGQYLDQLQRNTIYSLKGAGTTFMLLKGAIKEDYEYFKDELDGTFDYEDLKDMERFSSLNVVQYSDGFASFITKLPKPI